MGNMTPLKTEMPKTGYEFEQLCKEASNPFRIRKIVNLIELVMNDFKLHLSLPYSPKAIYNEYIGWGLPTETVCKSVCDFWNKIPESNLVDVGAGSGVFCMMFNDACIKSEKLIAVDSKDCKQYETKNQYWDVFKHKHIKVLPDDIFFISWGISDLEPLLLDYIERGGKYVIILGETDGEMNFSSCYFSENPEWQMVGFYQVQSTCSNVSEHISFNVRKNALAPFEECK